MLQELWATLPLLRQSITFSKILFFPSALIKWSKLDCSLRKSKGISAFKEKIFNFIRPSPNFVFDCHNPKRIKLITRLIFGLSHLKEHKFKYSFQETINPLCNCGKDNESSTHFFLYCPVFINERCTLLGTIGSLDSNLLDCTDYDLTQMLLFGNKFQVSNFKFHPKFQAITSKLLTHRYLTNHFLKYIFNNLQ